LLYVFLLVTLSLFTCADQNRGPRGYYNIRTIPGTRGLTATPCVYWEYRIENCERIEIYYRYQNKSIKIYRDLNVSERDKIFNSWKDKGLSHCPFRDAGNKNKTAVYYFKIKMNNKSVEITRAFVINREET